MDEVLRRRSSGADVLVSTNAIHLYDDLEDTLRAWARVLKPGGRVRSTPATSATRARRDNEWIIDETVYVVHEVAHGLVRTDPRWTAYRGVLDDPERMADTSSGATASSSRRGRSSYYLDALRAAGFAIEDVTERTIEANVDEWYEFLAAYADAVLGWVGGSEKVDGDEPAAPEAAADRLELLRESLNTIFGGRPTFRCCWTYITATRS